MAKESKRSVPELEIPVKNKNGDFEELRFIRYFSEHTEEVFPGCRILKKEYPLYGAYKMLERDVLERVNSSMGAGLSTHDIIGRIDLIIEYRGVIYIVEIKHKNPTTGSDFWDALKVVGYAAYFDWITELNPSFEGGYPAIMMPKEKIKLEHRIVANKLKIYIFGIIKTPYDYRVELLHNPYSKK